MRRQIAVVGVGQADEHLLQLAEEVGERIAAAGAVLVCGGRGGVMEAASRGARNSGGLVVGILPGTNSTESPPNPHLDTAVYTGIGQARNLAVVLSGEAVIAIGEGWGTLSEIALALKHGRRVISLESWCPQRRDSPGSRNLLHVSSAEEAVRCALHPSHELSEKRAERQEKRATLAPEE